MLAYSAMEPKPIKAVATLELTLSHGMTVSVLKKVFKDLDILIDLDEGRAKIDQVVGVAKIQPIPKEPKP